MIKNMNLLHYLSEETYKNICNTLALDSSKGSCVSYPKKAISLIEHFNISYKQFGHIWFLSVHINFLKTKCEYNDFNVWLFEQYKEIFGKKIMEKFPKYEQIICNYVEYYNILKVDNVDLIVKNVKEFGCPSVELDLDISDLKHSKKPHGKIEFCISKKDGRHIETLAHCFGTALKKRIKDKSYHGPVGIKVDKIVNKHTEIEIVNWSLKKYKLGIQLE